METKSNGGILKPPSPRLDHPGQRIAGFDEAMGMHAV
jgi:hypothetical protein